MFCLQCGIELPDTAQFCYFCGSKITPPEQKSALHPDGSDDRYYFDYGLQYSVMRALEENQGNDLIKVKGLGIDTKHGALLVKMPKERCRGVLTLEPEGVPYEGTNARILEYALNTQTNQWEIHDQSLEERKRIAEKLKPALFSSVLSRLERKDKAPRYAHISYLAVFPHVKPGTYRLRDDWKSPFEYVKPVVLEINAGRAYTFLGEGW